MKAPDSMLDKLILKDYRRPGTDNQDKKMQDLIGIRIILYYADDVEIVKNFLDTIFSMPGVWNTTEANEYEFRAMKINGIFKLPGYLSKTIVNPELGDYVDDTFEIQVRTNSFEGWHEIEHDMRYKGSAFGTGNEALARKMNSILATLELCDDSVVGLIEDLGHQPVSYTHLISFGFSIDNGSYCSLCLYSIVRILPISIIVCTATACKQSSNNDCRH